MSNQHRPFPPAVSIPIFAFLAGTAIVWSAAPLAAADRFRRADSNADGVLNLTDAIHSLSFLFRGSPDRVACEDAADANDDGELDVSDPVRLLLYLFLGAPAPPPPFGEAASDCGEDPTADALGCESYSPCPPLPPGPPSLIPPRSPTREPSVVLRGTAVPGLEVRVTGGVSPIPVLATAGPDGAFAAEVELTPRRLNRLFAVVEDGRGQDSAPASVEVIQDPEPPFVHADEPLDGSTVLTDQVTVAGRVADMLSGFQGLEVTVNEVPAAIAIGIGTNGTFERPGVPLALGANRIAIVARDAVGNTATREITVTREEIPPDADRIELVSGNRQPPRPIYTTLPEPIVVRARQADGTPIAGKLVKLRVVRSDGRLASSEATAADDGVMTLAVLTDEDGLAAVHWTLGGDAGCGNNRVRATAKGLAGEVLFCASAAPGPATRIHVGTGQNQRGEAGAPIPEALRAWVNDGCNGIPGVPVTFLVRRGTGTVDGAKSVTVLTGPTGHAQVRFVFGPEAGNQAVEADFDGNPGAPATFIAHASLRGEETQPTTLAGLVLDNAARPIQGVLCRLAVPGFDPVSTPTDLHGRFALAAPAAGPAALQVEGSFATHVGGESGEDVPLGSFPSLTYEVTLVPHAETSLASPVLLPPLDPDNAVVYDGTGEVVLRVKGIEGFEMRVAAGTTVTLGDRTRIGPGHPGSVRLSLNQVHQDDIPMAMPDGAAPPVAWTLQPRGATFDPPLKVTYPNVSALPPGAIANFLTFNHDTGKFEVFSSGRVASDGSAIESDPGSGISVAGWGGVCPPYPLLGDVERKGCSLTIDELDPNFAPSVELLHLRYTLLRPVVFAKLEVFRQGDSDNPIFTDLGIPRSGEAIDYTWDGIATLGPIPGGYIGPCLYTLRMTVAEKADLSDVCTRSRSFSVEVHSISLSTPNQPNLNKGEPPVTAAANAGEIRAEIRAAVKLKRKDQSGAATAVPIEVHWTFTDPGEQNATATESHAHAPPKALGKKLDPNASYWEGHPESASRSGDGFKLTAISETLASGAEQGTAKVFFKTSGVGGDQFVLKAAVQCQGTPLVEQESLTIVITRSIEIRNVYEMANLTHVSRNAIRATIQPYFIGTFVFYDAGERIAILPALSVKYIGLYQDAATPQLRWDEQQTKQAIPWTLEYGPYAESAGSTEVPTSEELVNAEYVGDNELLLILRDQARAEITMKAQAWAERIDAMNVAAQAAWVAAAAIPNHAMVGIQFFHPKYSPAAGEGLTDEWPEWVRVITDGGTGAAIDPDGYFYLGNGIAGQADTETGIVTMADAVSDAEHTNVIVHEVGHATKAVFPREDFGPNQDHSAAPGLMDQSGSLDTFTGREKKILRGYKQP